MAGLTPRAPTSSPTRCDHTAAPSSGERSSMGTRARTGRCRPMTSSGHSMANFGITSSFRSRMAQSTSNRASPSIRCSGRCRIRGSRSKRRSRANISGRTPASLTWRRCGPRRSTRTLVLRGAGRRSPPRLPRWPACRTSAAIATGLAPSSIRRTGTHSAASPGIRISQPSGSPASGLG